MRDTEGENAHKKETTEKFVERADRAINYMNTEYSDFLSKLCHCLPDRMALLLDHRGEHIGK